MTPTRAALNPSNYDNQLGARLAALESSPWGIGAMNANPTFAGGLGGYNVAWVNGAEATSAVVNDPANAWAGSNVHRFAVTPNTGVNALGRLQTQDAIPVVPGEVWVAEAWAKASEPGRFQGLLQAMLGDTAGNANYFGTGVVAVQNVGTDLTTSWQRIQLSIVVPAGVSFMRVDARSQMMVVGGAAQSYIGAFAIRRATPAALEQGPVTALYRTGSNLPLAAAGWRRALWNAFNLSSDVSGYDPATGVLTVLPGTFDFSIDVFTNSASTAVRLVDVGTGAVLGSDGGNAGVHTARSLTVTAVFYAPAQVAVELYDSVAFDLNQGTQWPSQVLVRRRFGVKGDKGDQGVAGSPAVTSRWAGDAASIPAGGSGTGMGNLTRNGAWSANDVGVVSSPNTHGIRMENPTTEVQLWSVTMVVRAAATITAARWILGLNETSPVGGAVAYRSAGSLTSESDVAATFTVPVLPGGRSLFPQIYQNSASAVNLLETRIEVTRINGAQGPAGTPGGGEAPVLAVTPAAPATDVVKVYARRRAGRRPATALSRDGFATMLQEHLATNTAFLLLPNGSAATATNIGATMGSSGTLTARTLAVTNLFTQTRRLGIVGAATAGSVARYSTAHQLWQRTAAGSKHGGFYCVLKFGVAAAPAGNILVAGMLSANPGATTNPTGVLNWIGLALGSADTNLSVMCRSGSGTQSTVALGALFPGTTASVDLYELHLFCPPGSTWIGWYVERLNTGDSAEGVFESAATHDGSSGIVTNVVTSANLPAIGTFLGPSISHSNNATAASAAFDVASMYCVSDL